MELSERMTSADKEAVKEWLKLELSIQLQMTCPFEHRTDMSLYSTKHDVCRRKFPKIKKNGRVCPCNVYKLTTVMKYARELLKEEY